MEKYGQTSPDDLDALYSLYYEDVSRHIRLQTLVGDPGKNVCFSNRASSRGFLKNAQSLWVFEETTTEVTLAKPYGQRHGGKQGYITRSFSKVPRPGYYVFDFIPDNQGRPTHFHPGHPVKLVLLTFQQFKEIKAYMK
jgi:hypothetical protein